MHSTLGVEQAAGREGWMHAVVAFAKPFRMPDFFLISGLFLARVIDRDWRDLSRPQGRALRLFLCAVGDDPVRLQGAGARRRAWAGAASRWLYLEAFIEPFGTLWFIYLLPIFFVVTKLTRGVPPLAIWLVARGARDRADPHRLDRDRRVRRRFVYFYTGYIFAPHIFALRRAACRRSRCAALAGLAAVGRRQRRCWCSRGYADLPFVSLRARPGRRRRRGRGRGAAGAERSCSGRCAIAARTPSSSISPSSCRWRRRASCCSRPASSPTSARSR